MTEQQLDAQGEARDALNSAVADFGPRVLSDPRMLGSRMSDLLPDLPKERQLLVTAAEADVAGELTRHIQEQHLDPNTAVQLVAGSLTDRKSIDPASSMWVATRYAQALGYPVRPGAMPPPVRPSPPPQPQPQPQPVGPETVMNYGYQDPTIGASGGSGGYAQPQPPSGGGGYYSQPQPPSGGAGYYPQQPVGGHAPPTGAPPQGTPAWTTPPPSKPPKRGLIYGLGAAAAAVVNFVGVAFGVGLFNSKPKPTPTPTPTISHSHSISPSPTISTNVLAPGVAPVAELLPADVNPATCTPKPKTGWANPGLVTSLSCSDSGVSIKTSNVIYAYQLNSTANYQSALANFNTWAGFSTNATSSCPPAGGATIGETAWNDTQVHNWFPVTSGQIIECGTVNNNEPTYAWTFPTDDAYIIVFGDSNSKFSSLDSWWVNNAEPAASPTPAKP